MPSMPRGTTQSPYTSDMGRRIHRNDLENRARNGGTNPSWHASPYTRTVTLGSDRITAEEEAPTSNPWDLGTSSLSEALRMSSLQRAILASMTRESPRLTPREPRPVQTVRDNYNDTLRFQCEGDSSLLAEVERCYRILRDLPAPRDRTPEQVDDLVVALTEEVATVTDNFTPDSLEENRYSTPF